MTAKHGLNIGVGCSPQGNHWHYCSQGCVDISVCAYAVFLYDNLISVLLPKIAPIISILKN